MKQVGIWIGVVLIIVLSVVGLVALSNASPPLQSTKIDAKLIKSTESDIVFGNKDAKVVVIEYADFECPACAGYFPLVRRLKSQYQEKVLVVYRYFPLKQPHPKAMVAAQASYAAHKQGKFWDMHDLLFENQETWAKGAAYAEFEAYAKKIELNMDQFAKDYDSEETKDFIDSSQQTGFDAGVNSTPTFFINGRKINNPRGYEEFKALIDQELK